MEIIISKTENSYQFNSSLKLNDIGIKKCISNYEGFHSKKYKYLLIDLDETIFDFYLSEKKSIINVFNYFNISYNDAILSYFSKINDYLFLEFQAGKYTRLEFQHERFKQLFKYLNVEYDYKEANSMFINNLSLGDDLIYGAKDILQYLNNLGYILYAASNGAKNVQINRLIKSGTYSYFNKIYVSDEVGYNKPKKEFFQFIVDNNIDKDLDLYLMIGDSVESDILGALNFGIDSIYINRCSNNTNVATYKINCINEIKKIL